MRPILITLFLSTFAWAQHPQVLLDSTALASMRAKVVAGDTDWLATKAMCDAYLTSITYWPSYLAEGGSGVIYSGNTGTLDGGNLGIGNGGMYQGDQYFNASKTLGACYQSLRTTNLPLARTYYTKAKEIIGALTQPPVTVQKGAGAPYYLAVGTKAGQAYGTFYWEQAGTGILAGDTVTIAGALGCTNLNGSWVVATSAASTITFTGLPAANADCLNHTWDYTRDSNFGARGYGIALSLLYDWFNPELTAGESAALTSTMTNYSNAIYRNGYGGPTTHPETNYSSNWSNFFTQCSAAWAKDNPTLYTYCGTKATANLFGTNGARDYYNRWLYGGGYGEGLAAYGWGALTALTESTITSLRSGVDWHGPPYNWNYIEDQAKYFLMSSKPDRNSMDEQEYVYFDIAPNPDNPTLFYPSLLYPMAWALQKQGSTYAPYFQSLIQHFESTSGVATDSLDRFIYHNASAPTSDPTTLPKSYRAWGGNFAAARSDWTPNAVLLHFQGGPSIGGASNGKTQFESGAFAIWNGANPFVVFGGGERSRSYDIINCTQADQLHNERSLYGNHKVSIFAADRPGTSFTRIDGLTAPNNPPGNDPTLTTYPTKIDRAEDPGAYAYYRSTSLQSVGAVSANDSQYHRQAWTRQILFIRPKIVVVYDTTTTKYTDDDRAMFWTFGRDLAQVGDPATGQHQFYSTRNSGATFKGALTTVLPASSAVSIVNHGIMTVSGSPKVSSFGTPLNFLYRVEQRPAAMDHTSDTWLSVADAATSPGAVESIKTLTATNADVVQLSTSGVVGFASGKLPISYSYTGSPDHRIAGLTPSAAYHVTLSAGPSATIVAGTGTGDTVATPAGVLAYKSSGSPSQAMPPAMTVTALACASTSLTSGASSACTVTTSAAAPAGGVSVAISSNNALLTAPASLTIPAGARTASFVATAGTIPSSQTAQLNATLNLGSATASFALTAAPATTCPCSVWKPTAAPTLIANSDTTAVELGLKFKSKVAGYVLGVRFYKGAANTGPHSGHLWTLGGTLLASVAFTNETTSGWQQASFATPVAVTANTTYIVSYWAPAGHHPEDSRYFTASGVDNGPLHAMEDGEAGNNGVYTYTKGGFPASSLNASNYWVDVAFSNVPSATPVVIVSGLNQTIGITAAPSRSAQAGLLSCAPSAVRAGDSFTCELRVAKQGSSRNLDFAVASSSSDIRLPAIISARAGQRSIQFRGTIDNAAPQSNISISIGDTGGNPSGQTEAQVAVLASPAPVLSLPTALLVKSGEHVSFRISAQDPAGLPVHISASRLPAGASFEPSSSRFDWTPAPQQEGAYAPVFSGINSAGFISSAQSAITVGSGNPVIARSSEVACSPGSIATVNGNWLSSADEDLSDPTGASTQLGGTTVQVNGALTSVLSSSPARVDFQCPNTAAGAGLNITLATTASTAAPLKTNMLEARPVLLLAQGLSQDQGYITLAGTDRLATTRSFIASGEPAQAGDLVSIRGTGLGMASSNAVISVTVGGIDAQVQSVVPVLDAAGVFLIKVRIPAAAPAGDAIPVQLEMISSTGSHLSSNKVTMAIE